MSDVGEALVLLRVELCGKLADTAGDAIEITIPKTGCSIATLFALVAEPHAELAAQIAEGRVRACINEIIVAHDARVMPGDQVALFPPVSGG